MKKKSEFILFLVWPLLVAFACFLFDFDLLAFGIFMYVIPSVYLSTQAPGQVRKSAFMALVWAIVWVACDLFWEANSAWSISSLASNKFLNIVSWELIAWAFFLPYLTIMMYEYFFERDGEYEKTRKLTRNAFYFSLCIFFLVALVVGFGSTPILFPFSYAIVGGIFCIPLTAWILVKYPNLMKKFLLISFYFFYQSLVIELVALKKGFWHFTEQSGYIGNIEIFHLSFPLEELLFWIVFGTITILAWYEFFDDDRK